MTCSSPRRWTRTNSSLISYTFTKAGTHSYYCSVHSKMTGQVVVKQVKGPSILQRDRYRSPFLFTAIPDSTRVAQNGTAEKTLRVRPRLFLEPIVRRLLRCGFVGAAALLLVARIGAQSSAVETPEANPGRPTVSTPATLTPVGYLQFENGGLYSETSPEFTTLFGINQVAKLTVASGFQLLALSEPLARASGATGDALSGSRIARGGAQTYRKPQLHSPSLRESRAGT